jgi:hypothetical protein
MSGSLLQLRLRAFFHGFSPPTADGITPATAQLVHSDWSFGLGGGACCLGLRVCSTSIGQRILLAIDILILCALLALV